MGTIAEAAIDNKIVKIIRDVVRESMEPFGLRDVIVRAGEDHDGDPVLFITAEYDLTDRQTDIPVTAALTTKLRDKLWATGETRFPHVRHNFADGQKIKPRKKARS